MFSGRHNLFALGISLLLVAASVTACAPTSDEDGQAEHDAEEWAWLEQTKAELDAKRAELRALEEQVAEGPTEDEDAGGEMAGGAEGEAEGEMGAEGEAAPDLEAQAVALAEDIQRLDQEFYGRLIDFINSQNLVEGQELTEVQRQAFDWKAEEDILVAEEYIEKAGDYQKAIDIYTTSLLADPTSELLLEARARAESLRYMTEERFAVVEKGMTRDEVRELLGIPLRMNIREFEKGVVGWFYPKEEPRTAAGIFFQEKDGELRVYRADFEAVKAGDEEES